MYSLGQIVSVNGKNGFEIIKLNKNSAKVKDPETGKLRIAPFAIIDVKEEASIPKSRKRNSTVEKPVKSVVLDVDPKDADLQDEETVEEKPVTRKRSRLASKNDEASELIASCNTEKQMLMLLRKKPYSAFVNKDSLQRLVEQVESGAITGGLVKMRVLNLLRGAINRSKSA